MQKSCEKPGTLPSGCAPPTTNPFRATPAGIILPTGIGIHVSYWDVGSEQRVPRRSGHPFDTGLDRSEYDRAEVNGRHVKVRGQKEPASPESRAGFALAPGDDGRAQIQGAGDGRRHQKADVHDARPI